MHHEVTQTPVADRLDRVLDEAERRWLRVVRLYVTVREWHTLTGGAMPPASDLLAFRGVPLQIHPSEA